MLLLLLFVSVRSEDLVLGRNSVQVRRLKNLNGTLERTIILPKVDAWETDNFVLISNSSSPMKPQDMPKIETPRMKRRRRKKRPIDLDTNETNYKDPKFLNLFTIIRFPNDDCEDNGGTCYHQMECNQMGGKSGGTCARGYGVCCAVEVGCGTSGPINGVILAGGSQEGACSMNINKLPCTKQIRFDFIDLELDPPIDGICMNERLLITGQNKNDVVPVICGSNSGQHMYIDVDEVPGPFMISVISPVKKDFKIKVSQICDGSDKLAPKHCLQYHTDDSGEFESFNYADGEEPSSYMNNLNYAICIKKGDGKCSVTYTNMNDDGEEYPMEINNVDAEGALTVPPGQAGAEIFNCPDDYIALSSVRLCGQKLNDATGQPDFTQNYPVTDFSNGPFRMSFVTNGATSGRGFKLKYSQNDC